MTAEQAESLWNRITTATDFELSDKEKEVLDQVLRSEPMAKAMSIVYAHANAMPSQFIGMDLLDQKQLGLAIRGQGTIQGMVTALETLLKLATETIDVSGATDE